MKTTIINKGLRVGVCAVVAASLAIGSVAAITPGTARADETLAATTQAAPTTPTQPTRTPVSYKTLAGETALDTMEKIQKDAFAPGSCETVIVTTAGTFQDALSAAGLAGALRAKNIATGAASTDVPILSTASEALSPQTTAALAYLGAKKVIITGGEMAIAPAVSKALSDNGLQVSRVWGTDGIATALATNEFARAQAQVSDTAIVATSAHFADGLSVAPYAYASAAPIYLASADGSLTPQTAAALADYKNIKIVGGEAVVSADTEAALKATATVERWFGTDCYRTSADIANKAVAAGVLSFDTTSVATGQSYHDALSATSAAGAKKSPVVLVDVGEAASYGIANTIATNAAAITSVAFLGGEVVVTPVTSKSIKQTLQVWIPNVVEVVVDDYKDTWVYTPLWGGTWKEWEALEAQGHTIKPAGTFCTHCKFLVLAAAYDPATCNTPTWDWEQHGGAGPWSQSVVIKHYQAPENKECLTPGEGYDNSSDTYGEMDGHMEHQKIGSHTETIDKGHWDWE